MFLAKDHHVKAKHAQVFFNSLRLDPFEPTPFDRQECAYWALHYMRNP